MQCCDCISLSQPGAAGTQPEQSAEWRWNLGGPPSRPRSAAASREPSNAARNASRPAGHSPSDSTTSQRPWQRRRLIPEGSDQAVHQSTSEAPADTSRWQRFGRFLGQWLPGGQTHRTPPEEQPVTSNARAQANTQGLSDAWRQHHPPQGRFNECRHLSLYQNKAHQYATLRVYVMGAA